MNNIPKEVLEKAVNAVNLNLKEQLAGQPIPGTPYDPLSWSATGNHACIDKCVISALNALGLVPKPIEEAKKGEWCLYVGPQQYWQTHNFVPDWATHFLPLSAIMQLFGRGE